MYGDTMAKEGHQTSQLAGELDAANVAGKQLHEAISQLESRLSDVLTPRYDQPTTVGGAPTHSLGSVSAPRAPLLGSIESLAADTRRSTDMIHKLLDRIAI